MPSHNLGPSDMLQQCTLPVLSLQRKFFVLLSAERRCSPACLFSRLLVMMP